MHTIELDAINWKTVAEYCNALSEALGSPKGYTHSLDGLLELMVWNYASPEMMDWHKKTAILPPPYTVRIYNSSVLPEDVLDELKLLKVHLLKAREEFHVREGYEVDVNLEIL